MGERADKSFLTTIGETDSKGAGGKFGSDRIV